MFKATTRFDRVFEVGIILKGLDGLLETAGGVILLFISPAFVHHLAVRLTHGELSEDPHDWVSTHVLHSTHGLVHGGLLFAAIYLLAHGVSKIVLVWEILHERLWAYLGLIYLTVGFMIYQLYRIAYDPKISLILLTIFDAIIVYLTVVEYRKRKRPALGP